MEIEAPIEQPVRPLKIKLRQQEQEPPNGINMRTQEEKVEEEPTDTPLHRQKRSDSKQKGDESGPVKDSTSTPHSEEPEPMKETELDG